MYGTKVTPAQVPEARESSPRRALITQATRFLVVGVVSYLVDLGMLLFLNRVGVPLPLATSVGWVTGFGVNFGLNRVWSFESDAPLRGALARYVALAAGNFAVTVVAVPVLTWAGLDLAIAKTGVVVVLAACNFVLYRIWVFPRANQTPRETAAG